MKQSCSPLRTGAAIRFSLIAFTALAVVAVMPSPAEAQPGACSAQGSIGPIPLGGFNCATGLQVGQELDILYIVSNNSTTIPPGTDVAADLRGIVTAEIACEDSICTMEIPTAFNYVDPLLGENGCVARAAGVDSCAAGAPNSNEIIITMTGDGVQIPPGDNVPFVTVRVEARDPRRRRRPVVSSSPGRTPRSTASSSTTRRCIPHMTGQMPEARRSRSPRAVRRRTASCARTTTSVPPRSAIRLDRFGRPETVHCDFQCTPDVRTGTDSRRRLPHRVLLHLDVRGGHR